MKGLVSILFILLAVVVGAAEGPAATPFPKELADYSDPVGGSVMEVLRSRVAEEPFNIVATVIFLLAVLHTFATGRIRHWAHVVEQRHCERLKIRTHATDSGFRKTR